MNAVLEGVQVENTAEGPVPANRNSPPRFMVEECELLDCED
jgi:hypothetical protein